MGKPDGIGNSKIPEAACFSSR